MEGNNTRPRLRLITGFALDARAITVMGFSRDEVEAWDLLPPMESESLRDYALRMSEAMGHGPEDAIGGISMGGMLAMEIARLKGARKLILLSTATHPKGIRLPFRALIPLLPLIPDILIQSTFRLLPTALRRLGLIDSQGQKLLYDILSQQSITSLRRFPAMILNWEGCKPTRPYAWLQSRKDWLFKAPMHVSGVEYWPGRHHLLTVPYPGEAREWVEGVMMNDE
jgi:pimeloyl-ACP methyl ester carboxylesterase